jgi:NAD-dependent DNA ligase
MTSTQTTTTKGVDVLLGIVTGIVADGNLHDMEVQMLRTWLSANPSIANTWPGSSVNATIEDALEDGVISHQERENLLTLLSGLSTNQFAETGSASTEVVALPLDQHCPVSLNGAKVCLTGEFSFGTRAECELATTNAGAKLRSTVNGKTDYLVIGAMVSSAWAHTTFGRKIQQAIDAQSDGSKVKLISEERWKLALA